MSRKKNTTVTNADGATSEAGSAANEATRPARTRTPRDPNAPPVKRPRAGSWLPVVRTYQIPGTDLSIDVEMYTVEFAGETLEVKRDRAGVAKANAWIKGIKARGEEALRVDRIRRQLEEMSEAASTQEMTARLYTAARVLGGGRLVKVEWVDEKTEPTSVDREPTA